MVNMTDRCLQRNLSKILTLIPLRPLHSLESITPLRLIVMAALILSSVATHAEEIIQTSCKNGDLVRRVVVAESRLASGLSCEVIYWKDTEAPGARQVLWTARQDAGYCYSKALALVNQLEAMGWICGPISPPVDLSADQFSFDAIRISQS